jgi:lipopolysaccharide/colanic/teichoic acid biosynthesis glycosyltransferase
MKYISPYSPEQARRHAMRPGVSGWAQVNGRNTISWDDKFQFDIWYVDYQSFWLDLKISFLTFKKVLLKDGISQDNEEFMRRFDHQDE